MSVAEVLGRGPLLERLDAALARAEQGERVTVLVAGEAGIGKTALIRAAVAAAAHRGARVAWGVCLDTPGAPGHWPWTQALTALVREIGVGPARALAGEDAPLLALLCPAFGPATPSDGTGRDRLLLLDAAARFLDRVSADAALVLVLDDLQWADESSLALLDFVARSPAAAGVCLIGAYRPDELRPGTRERLTSCGEHLPVAGIDADAVHDLVQRLRGTAVERSVSDAIAERTRGHPFFVREVALLAPDDQRVPAPVADLIERRIAQLDPTVRAVLAAAAVLATTPRVDVLAGALGLVPTQVEDAIRSAVDAGVLLADGPRFSHDLLRETVLAGIDAAERVVLHRALGAALEDRSARAGDVAPAEPARQFVAAVALDGPQRALRWALAAAAADREALAFDEAAGHLRRLRAAVADAGLTLGDPAMFEVLLAEADALARGGATIEARGLLRAAADVADRTGDPERIARAALAVAGLGSQFAVRRDEIVAALERALAAVTGVDPAAEARLAAALARELQHSVAADRPRAGPLSERALRLGRATGDPATLAACLFARHDVLWTPGTAAARAELAREIVAVARAAGDDERRADGLVLLATALLEEGSPTFETALVEGLSVLDGLGQPRHRYLAQTRRACLALLRGDLDEAEELVERAAALGERIREPDTGNVRMSQRLELVRSRGDAAELRAFAAEAVAHWTGVPIHAHAVAAGFAARAGDLDLTHHHLVMVADLGGWRAEASYLRAVYVRELAEAAVVLGETELCADLLEHLEPLAGLCGLNAAVVAFAGSFAHPAARLAAALGRAEQATELRAQAAGAYRRLGATRWLAEVEGVPSAAGATLHRRGPVWEVSFAGRSATVPHVKGLADLARLLAAPGREIHVLDLMESADRSAPSGELADRAALAAYRRRLTELEADADCADADADLERAARLRAEREALLDELGRVTGLHGRARPLANSPTERARKAVAARVRDAIRRLEPVLPELAAHLDASVVTGAYCRYRSDDDIAWDVRGR